ncbi:hypothetical protein JTE90_002517, partial [Oedothorax gibbosus]
GDHIKDVSEFGDLFWGKEKTTGVPRVAPACPLQNPPLSHAVFFGRFGRSPSTRPTSIGRERKIKGPRLRRRRGRAQLYCKLGGQHRFAHNPQNQSDLRPGMHYCDPQDPGWPTRGGMRRRGNTGLGEPPLSGGCPIISQSHHLPGQ